MGASSRLGPISPTTIRPISHHLIHHHHLHLHSPAPYIYHTLHALFTLSAHWHSSVRIITRRPRGCYRRRSALHPLLPRSGLCFRARAHPPSLSISPPVLFCACTVPSSCRAPSQRQTSDTSPSRTHGLRLRPLLPAQQQQQRARLFALLLSIVLPIALAKPTSRRHDASSHPLHAISFAACLATALAERLARARWRYGCRQGWSTAGEAQKNIGKDRTHHRTPRSAQRHRPPRPAAPARSSGQRPPSPTEDCRDCWRRHLRVSGQCVPTYLTLLVCFDASIHVLTTHIQSPISARRRACSAPSRKSTTSRALAKTCSTRPSTKTTRPHPPFTIWSTPCHV